jgi:putative transposase
VIFIVKETIDIMLKAYKYKIKPNSQQQELLQKFFGCVRFIYNWGLERKTSAYKENGTKVGYVELARELTSLKKTEEHQWLNECSNESLQQSLRCLDNAFTNFFRKKGKYPKFKSRKGKNSAKFINSVHFDFDNWTVKLPKLGKIKLCKNRTFDQSKCKQGTCTVSRDHCGTYWCVITVDDLHPKVARTKPLKETAVGIDLGIKDYAILSDGTKFTNPKHLEKAQRKLAWLQRDFARTAKGSKNHEKMRVKVAKCYRTISNQRNDFLHKLSTHLVRNYDTICLEDLNVKGMEQNHHLTRAIQDAAWSEFVRQLEYKSEWYGKNVLFIGRFEPSSKLCHKCGYINRDLKLSDREWTCPICGEHHDRDINAAINIKEIAFDKQNLVGV